MSPAAAAVECQSPFNVKPSSTTSSNTIQNPNSNASFNSFSSSDDRLKNQPHSTNPSSASSFGDADGCGFGVGVGSGTGSRVGSGRTKPRLAKLRKQLGRSKNVASETAYGFNPFRSKGEDSCQINCKTSLPNNKVFENCDRMYNDANVLNNLAFENEKVEFVFCAKKSDMDLERVSNGCANLNSEIGESGENVKNPASENVSFVFGVNRSGVQSSSKSEKSECIRNASNSGLGFVFGASWRTSMSNGNSEQCDSGENNGKPESNDQWKDEVQSETESLKVKATEVNFECSGSLSSSEDYRKGAFMFAAGNEESLGSSDFESLKFPNATNLNRKNFGNDNSIGRTVNDNVDFNVNCKSKFVSESSCDRDGAASTDPAVILPNEMKKLHINESENDCGAGKKYDSNKNLCVDANTKFVFSTGLKPYSSSTGSSDLSREQTSAPDAADERKEGDKCGTHDSDRIVFGNSCNTDSAPSVGVHVSEATSVGAQKKDDSSPQGLGVSFTEFTTPSWDPTCFKANLYPELDKKLHYGPKSRSIKDKRSKKTRGKLKQRSFLEQGLNQVHVPKQSNLQENLTSPDCYSPMDFSPYVETMVGDEPRETSVTSNESFHPDQGCAPSASLHSVTTDPKDENFANTERFDINENFGEPNEENSGHRLENTHVGDCRLKGFVFGSDTAYSSFIQEQLCCTSGSAGASAEHADGLNTKIHESLQYSSAAGIEDQKHFSFSASSTAEGGLTHRRRQLRKKVKKKVGNDSFIISPSSNVKFSSSSVDGRGEDRCTSNGEVETISEAFEQVKQGFISSNAAFQEACEMWRHRGNQAYKNGSLSKAEDFYTQGINSIPLGQTAGCCIKPLLLCYSNRAATRISLGRMREALEDCMMAANIDPNFLKVYVRAANCHLVLGEVDNALQYYSKLLESGPELCLDRRITIEAADGQQKAQKVAECTNRSSKLLEQKTTEAASNALEIIAEALSISSCSEKLLEMKAEALYMLRKYQQAIQMCEQTLCTAEKNFALVGTDNCSACVDASGNVECSLARLWRWRLISKSYFCMGKLEAALDVLQKLEQVGSIKNKYGSEILESSLSLAATIHELLRRKNAGNEAVRSGRYTEAVEHYTTALSSNIESRPFAAICFCNRAAALQAMGQIADAIADCSLAMALDGNYTKAVSRRALLHEMIRDYSQAAGDLQRLVSILENRSNEIAKQSDSPSRSTGSKEIRQARRHMSLMEEEAKKGVPLDFYLILGVKASDAASDIKKAYRKAALRHHPDKAGQFLVRTENGDEGRLWKEIAHEVHNDADRLFKMIGEAYAILSEPTKRSEYDLEEEIRKAPKESHQGSPYGKPSDGYSYSSRRSRSKQYWQESWKTYGNSYSRW